MGYCQIIISVGKKKGSVNIIFLIWNRMKKYNLIYNNLHIFFNFAKFATWENERRKVNIRIFAIRMLDKPNSLDINLKC